jgi:predicted RNA binding protein with dsRBD fold (UPF0201 family)
MKPQVPSQPFLIHFRVPVRASESKEKVITALHNALPGRLTIEEHQNLLTGSSDDPLSLSRIYEALRGRQVLNAARRLLLRNLEGSKTMLLLNKQAAYANVIALCEFHEESPLGPIELTVKSEDLKGLIEWLAPRIE